MKTPKHIKNIATKEEKLIRLITSHYTYGIRVLRGEMPESSVTLRDVFNIPAGKPMFNDQEAAYKWLINALECKDAVIELTREGAGKWETPNQAKAENVQIYNRYSVNYMELTLVQNRQWTTQAPHFLALARQCKEKAKAELKTQPMADALKDVVVAPAERVKRKYVKRTPKAEPVTPLVIDETKLVDSGLPAGAPGFIMIGGRKCEIFRDAHGYYCNDFKWCKGTKCQAPHIKGTHRLTDPVDGVWPEPQQFRPIDKRAKLKSPEPGKKYSTKWLCGECAPKSITVDDLPSESEAKQEYTRGVADMLYRQAIGTLEEVSNKLDEMKTIDQNVVTITVVNATPEFLVKLAAIKGGGN